MFGWLGRFSYRFRRWVLAGTVLVLAVAATWGVGVFGALGDAGFDDPDAESSVAADVAEGVMGGDADVVILLRHRALTVEDPAFEDGVEQVLASLPADRLSRVVTYYETGSDDLVSDDRRATYVAIQLAEDEAGSGDAYDELVGAVAEPRGFDVGVGGQAAINHDVNAQVSEDIAQAEMLSFPILLVLLLLVFGGVVAASLPLAVGGVAVLGAFTLLHALTTLTDVSVFAVNIVTMLGLGLAIDYALFIVTRFREEMRGGASTEAALVRTMTTAGRTVAVSGLTVAVALSSLLLFPQTFFRSMGLGGISAVVVAMATSLTALPALLAVLGPRVDKWKLPLRRGSAPAPDRGTWFRVAASVMRRPVLYIAVIVPGLLILGSSFLRVEFGGIDHRALPDGTESREVAESLVRDFPSGTDPVRVVAQDASRDDLQQLASQLERLDGVTAVAARGSGDGSSVLDVHHTYDAYSTSAKDLVAEVRRAGQAQDFDVLVTGTTAFSVDLLDSLGDTLPWMALWVFLTTYVLLFLAFGSVVLPLKAILMNLLSLTASFGAIVWIFQDGNLSDVLGFTPTGTVEASQPILILAIAFGLSMDYEVFLLSRIREQWDLTGDNTLAVATGIQRTGGLITSAALLLVVVIGAFSTSGITFIKMIGVGMAIAIVVDATVVRALLVPATMRLLGSANWWLPSPLDGFWRSFGIREHDGPDVREAPVHAAANQSSAQEPQPAQHTPVAR